MTAPQDFGAYHQIDIALTCLAHAGRALRSTGDPDRLRSTALWLARAEMALKRIQPGIKSPSDRAKHAAACAMLEDAEAWQQH